MINKCCEDETWKFIEGYEPYYMISSCGRVITCRRRGALPGTPPTVGGACNQTGEWKELNQHLLPFHKGHRCLQVYLYKEGMRKIFSLHRLVYKNFNGDIPSKSVIDHINRNSLDNHISNLRVATQAQNQINSINKNRGVFLCKEKGKPPRYRASISYNGTKMYLGRFKTLEEALVVRKNAEILYYGEFSNKAQ